MPIERHYRVLAYPVRILASPRLGAFLRRFLAPFESDVASDAHLYELRREPGTEKPWAMYLDGRSLHRGRTPSRILEFALWDINTKAIGSDHGFLAVHAAAASWRGSGIVLPAPADSGKSTIVAGLTRAGCAYLSDEAALIDPRDGLLHPYPRSLWLEKPSVDAVFKEESGRQRWSTGRQVHVRPSDLRPRSIGRRCPIGHVIMPSYEPGSGGDPEPIARAEALMALARNTFHLDRFGAAGIELMGRVVEGARCYRIRIDDLDRAVRSIVAVLDRDRGPNARRTWAPVGLARTGSAGQPPVEPVAP
jgi:hypothetical protein